MAFFNPVCKLVLKTSCIINRIISGPLSLCFISKLQSEAIQPKTQQEEKNTWSVQVSLMKGDLVG